MQNDHAPAADSQAAKKTKQLVVIAVLLLGLLIAIFTQPSDDAKKPSVIAAEPVALKAVDSNSLQDPDAPREELVATRELSRIEIDRLLQTSLFYQPPPEVEPEGAIAGEGTTPEVDASEVEAQAIYGSGTLAGSSQAAGHRVLIGKEIVRPGQVLPDGRQIVIVIPDGKEAAD